MVQLYCNSLRFRSQKRVGGVEKSRPESAVVCGQPGQRERETEWAVRHRERQSWEKAKGKKNR